MNIVRKYIKEGKIPRSKEIRKWIIVGIPILGFAQIIWYFLMEALKISQFTLEVNVIAFVFFSLIFIYKGISGSKLK